MKPRWDAFPVQARPLYNFYITDGRLVRKEHARYRTDTIRNKLVYRIYAYGGMKTKESPGQLDKILNNHLWTFDPDPSRAIKLFLDRAEADKIKAMTMLESAKQDLKDAKAAEQRLIAGEVITLSMTVK